MSNGATRATQPKPTTGPRSKRATRNRIIWQDMAQQLTAQGYTPVTVWWPRSKLILAYNLAINMMARAAGVTASRIDGRVHDLSEDFLRGSRFARRGFQRVTVEALGLDDPELDIICPHCGKLVPPSAIPDPDRVDFGKLAPIDSPQSDPDSPQ